MPCPLHGEEEPPELAVWMCAGGVATDFLDGPCGHAAGFNGSTLDWGDMMTLDQAALRAYAEEQATRMEERRCH
jgi:hypothetical protein